MFSPLSYRRMVIMWDEGRAKEWGWWVNGIVKAARGEGRGKGGGGSRWCGKVGEHEDEWTRGRGEEGEGKDREDGSRGNLVCGSDVGRESGVVKRRRDDCREPRGNQTTCIPSSSPAPTLLPRPPAPIWILDNAQQSNFTSLSSRCLPVTATPAFPAFHTHCPAVLRMTARVQLTCE